MIIRMDEGGGQSRLSWSTHSKAILVKYALLRDTGEVMDDVEIRLYVHASLCLNICRYARL